MFTKDRVEFDSLLKKVSKMNKKRTLKNVVAEWIVAVAIISIVVGIMVGIFACLGMCWEYAINTCLELADSPKQIALWQGMLISLVPGAGQLAPLAALFAWLLTLFLV